MSAPGDPANPAANVRFASNYASVAVSGPPLGAHKRIDALPIQPPH